MKTLWSGDSKINELFVEYTFGTKNDWVLIEFEWQVQKAHLETLYCANIFSEKEYHLVGKAISELAGKYTLVNYPTAPNEAIEHEDIHSFVEYKICEIAGSCGKKIHTARSRNDQVATLTKLFTNKVQLKISENLNTLVNILTVKGRKYEHSLLPITTHFQQAAVGSIGHYLKFRAHGFSLISNDLNYFITKNMSECPLGSGACVGSSVPIDRTIQANLLGFDRPSSNSLYSTSCRDEIVETTNIMSKTSLELINFCNELIIWSNQNFDWVDLPKDFCSGSSMMPNKLNPDFLELLRCEFKEFLNYPAQVLQTLSSLPSGYNRDYQLVKDAFFQRTLRFNSLLNFFTTFIDLTEFKVNNIKDSGRLGFIDATLRMEELVMSGEALRDAHHEIASTVQGKREGRFYTSDEDLLVKYKTFGSPNCKTINPVEDKSVKSKKN